MYGDATDLDKAKAKLNSVSPSFCMAKWMHTTLHLGAGRTHSCYLPPTHQIPLEEIAKDPSALHNTQYKKEQRRKMLTGERPAECGMCWAIEDLSPPGVSDRIFRGTDSWTLPHFDRVKNLPWDANINPTYLEVSFSSVCNFMCSYCSPHVSTRWHQEITKHGAYKLTELEHQNLEALKGMGLMSMDEDANPYIDAFWKWWPELSPKLEFFRVTGGEPLLSKHTFKVFDWVDANPLPNLNLEINSNLGVPTAIFDRFIDKAKSLLAQKKIGAFRVHTSIDTFGEQAEYIRHGLSFANFDRNVRKYLTEIPEGGIAFMSTFNALSVTDYPRFLDWVLELRREFNNSHREVLLDIAHLSGPEHQSIRVLTPDYEDRIRDIIVKVERSLAAEKSLFRPMEPVKLHRILEWMRVPQDPAAVARWRSDFYLFFSEHDRRRGTDFLKTFPQMRLFWETCRAVSRELLARRQEQMVHS